MNVKGQTVIKLRLALYKGKYVKRTGERENRSKVNTLVCIKNW